ncbi:TolC family protein [Glaciecola siphonariae]|uniref:TolC family protein n=1 Tax=Glaciecola siphonariae TaxID=521012 RepID=A0ABV9LTL3_9ALTE
MQNTQVPHFKPYRIACVHVAVALRSLRLSKVASRLSAIGTSIISISAFCISSAHAATALSYSEAKALLSQQSDAIQAAQYQVDSQQDKLASLDRLHLPTLSILGGVHAYESKRELDIEPIRDAAGDLIPGSEQFIRSSIDVNFNGVLPTAVLMSTWELYAGGRIDAARRAADAAIAEAKAEQSGTFEEQEKLLATVYFGQLLAKQILHIREEVAKDIAQHVHQATRFEENGLISKVERLHAQVAYDEALRNLEQAKADLGMANNALQRLLRVNTNIQPRNKLFVISQPLPPLDSFLAQGLQNHSQLTLIRAKRERAEQGQVIEEARFKPNVFAFGSYNLAPQEADFSDPLPLLEPDWIVGINVSYKLFDSINRNKAISAARLQVDRVGALEREFSMRLGTYIENSYRSLEKARNQYALLASSIDLAQETLKLRVRLFEEGMGTSLDVVDARLSAAKAETEKAAAAYNFVVALVDLLIGAGQLHEFERYMTQADILVSTDTLSFIPSTEQIPATAHASIQGTQNEN